MSSGTTWAWQGKITKIATATIQTNRQTNKQKSIKGILMSYDSTNHLAQFLAKNIRMDEEIDNPAASSRSFLH